MSIHTMMLEGSCPYLSKEVENVKVYDIRPELWLR
jgi:Fe-S-cluster containining protein